MPGSGICGRGDHERIYCKILAMKKNLVMLFISLNGIFFFSEEVFSQQTSTYQVHSYNEPVKVVSTVPDTSPVVLYVPKKITDFNTVVEPVKSVGKEEKIIVNEPKKINAPNENNKPK